MIKLLQEEYVDPEDKAYNDYWNSLNDVGKQVERFSNRFYSNFCDFEYTYGYDFMDVWEGADFASSMIFSILRKIAKDYKLSAVKADPPKAEKEDTQSDLYLDTGMSIYFADNSVINGRLLDKFAQMFKRYKVKKKGMTELVLDLGTHADFECEFDIILRSSTQIEFWYTAHLNKSEEEPRQEEYADEYDI